MFCTHDNTSTLDTRGTVSQHLTHELTLSWRNYRVTSHPHIQTLSWTDLLIWTGSPGNYKPYTWHWYNESLNRQYKISVNFHLGKMIALMTAINRCLLFYGAQCVHCTLRVNEPTVMKSSNSFLWTWNSLFQTYLKAAEHWDRRWRELLCICRQTSGLWFSYPMHTISEGHKHKAAFHITQEILSVPVWLA